MKVRCACMRVWRFESSLSRLTLPWPRWSDSKYVSSNSILTDFLYSTLLFQNRWLLIQLIPPTLLSSTQFYTYPNLTPQKIYTAIKQSVMINFGDVGWGAVANSLNGNLENCLSLWTVRTDLDGSEIFLSFDGTDHPSCHKGSISTRLGSCYTPNFNRRAENHPVCRTLLRSVSLLYHKP
jgi:Rpp14/Pop5 family